MSEMLPEYWLLTSDDEGASKRHSSQCRWHRVPIIFDWIQCFCSYVSVLTPAYPEVIPELMAYMGTIVKASQEFGDIHWARYDAGYRRQAALTGNRLWSHIHIGTILPSPPVLQALHIVNGALRPHTAPMDVS